MKAVIVEEFGPIKNATLKEVPDPAPKPGEVTIDVKVAEVNFPDILVMEGKYQFKPPLPFSPGSEGAGTISAIGKNVTNYKVGDRVSFISGWGAFCEKIAVNQKQVIKIPDTITFDLAAATQITYGTSYHALIQRGNLRENNEILILGASGGVGLAALDIAKSFNARVVAGISSEEKAVVCRNYGADDVVIYGTEKLDTEGQKALSSQFKEKSQKGGYDIIYDPIGDCFAEPALRTINWKGRYLVIGFAAGEIPKIPLNLALLKGCAIVGVFWGSFTSYEPQKNVKNIIEIGKLIAIGKINPFISKSIPMELAKDAIKMIGERKVVGKVVLVNN